MGWIKGTIEYRKVQLKEFVFKIAYVRYKKFKAKRKATPMVSNDSQPQVFPIEPVAYDNDLVPIDYTTEEYRPLRSIFFDFLYTSIDNVKDARVLEVSKDEKIYLIVGRSKMQKVILKN